MPTKRVNEPILDGGIRTANYQNGRLLSAEDLKVDQEAARERVQRLGLALGSGVVRGLEVTGRDRTSEGYSAFEVSAGLAVNGLGESLMLPVPVALTTNALTAGPGRSSWSGFTPWQPPAPTPEEERLSLHLLVVAPAQGYEGGVPHPVALAGHDRRYAVEGVQFRLLPFRPPFQEERTSLLRNRIAYQAIYAADDSLQATLARQCEGSLTPADLPLALVGMADRYIQFIDIWAVRRRSEFVAEPFGPAELRVARRAQNEAFYRHFQHQLDELTQGRSPDAPLRAREHFRYLPPVGYLDEVCDRRTFLGGLEAEEAVIDEGFLQARLESSWWAEPIDLAMPASVWVYTPPGKRYTLFLRREKVKERVELDGGNAIVVEVTRPGGEGLVEVSAAGEDGKLYPARPDGRRFRIAALPAGAYTVWVGSAGYKTTYEKLLLQPGKTERLGIILQPAAPVVPAPARPEERYPANWLKPWQNRSLAVRGIRRPRSGVLPAELSTWSPMASPPADLLVWLRSWGGWLAATQPELPIDPDGLRLLVNPDANRRAYLRRPWGYAVYGMGGIRLPLMIAPRFKARRDLFKQRLLPPSELGPDDPWSKIVALPEVAATQRLGLLKRLLSLFIKWEGGGEKKN